VLHKSFYPLNKVIAGMDYQKRSNMINQIQKMGEFVLKGDLKVLDNESYRITFSIPQKYEDVFIFAIDDKKSSKPIIEGLLDKIGVKFQNYYPNLSPPQKVMEIGNFQEFSSVIEQTLADERFTPLDRIKNFLL
jgi:hypothetical protein